MTNTTTFKVTKQVSFARKQKARRIKPTSLSAPAPLTDSGRVPRISRLMALAIRFQQHIDDGVVDSQAEIARLSHVTRARVTQIMNLLHLPPDIQEQILFLPPTEQGRDAIREIHIRPLVAVVEWDEQRARWLAFVDDCQIVRHS